MKKIHKVLLGIAFFLIFFVYFVFETAPAAKVIKMIDLPKEISLVGVTGTVFDGAASNLTIDKYSYENIRWHTSLWGLITKQLTLIVKDPQGLNGIGSVQFNKDGSYDFEDVKMKISFANFLKYAKYSLPVKVNGNIDLSIDEASMSMNKCRKLKGNVGLDGVVLFTPMGDFDLGSSKIDLNCRNGLLIAKMMKVENEFFSLDGNMEYDLPRRAYVVRAFAKPKENHRNEVSMLLQMFGKMNPTGTYEIVYQGTFTY
jgi:general secretion pathway protein N